MLIRFLLPIALCTVASAVSAQLQPEQRFLYPQDSEGYAVFDADADGDMDIVRSADGTLLLHEQLSSGEFTVSRVFGPCRAFDIRTADIDADGVVDIVAGDADGSRIRWAKGLGGGDYSPLLTAVNGTPNPYDVHLADLDGDGDLDLLHVDVSASTSYRWNANNGSGIFGPSNLILSGTGITGMAWLENHAALGDIDQDGDVDFAVCHPTQAWWSNDGAGNFTQQTLYQVPGGSEPLLTDLDGDGDPDLVLAVNANPSNCYLEGRSNLGGGVFAAPQTLSAFPGGPPVLLAGVHDADVDGDGDRDLVVAYEPGTSVTNANLVLINNGNGAFPPNPLYTFMSNDMMAIGIGDVDGNGMDDIISTVNHGVEILYSGLGTTKLLTSVDRPRSVVPMDVDGYLDMDMLVVGPAPWGPTMEGGPPLHAAVHLNEGSDIADPAVICWAAEAGMYEADAGDLDGDGDDDLAAMWGDPLTGTTKKMMIMLSSSGVPDSVGQAGQSFNAFPFTAQTPWLRDLDQDGDLDIVRADGSYPGAITQLNLGGGSFAPEQSWNLNTTSISPSTTTCDVDTDGDADIVQWNYITSQLVKSSNNGLGTFTPFQVLLSTPIPMNSDADPRSPMLRGVDLTNDGWEDIVVFTGDSIAVLLNNSGTWSTGQQFAAFATAYAVGDIDNSGSPDLVAIRSNREVVAWLNMGLGIFAPELLLADASINTGTDHIALADVDGDALNDVITCSTNGHSAAWMRNGGNIGTGLTPVPPDRSSLSAFPVPMRDRLQVKSTSPITPAQLAQVLDMQGRIVHSLRGNGTNTVLLDRGDLAPGLYVVRITDHGAVRFVAE